MCSCSESRHRLVQCLLLLLCSSSFIILSPRHSSPLSLSYLIQLHSSSSCHRVFDPETSVCLLPGHILSPYITTSEVNRKLTSSSFSHHLYSHSVGVVWISLTFAGVDVFYVRLLDTRLLSIRIATSLLPYIYALPLSQQRLIVKCLLSQ